jgi:Domain of unknown function (DUF4404)
MESKLNEKLTSLRHSIEEIAGLPEAQRGHLLASLTELETALAAQDESHPGPLGRLEDSLLELEAKHPDVSQLLKNAAEALGRMGL